MEQVMEHYREISRRKHDRGSHPCNYCIACTRRNHYCGALLGRICGDGVQECADGILFPHEWLNAIGRMTWGRS